MDVYSFYNSGNNFGEAIDMLKESLEAKNLLEALGSFSDDEGLLSAEDSEEDGESEGDIDQIPFTKETVSSPLKKTTPPPEHVSQSLDYLLLVYIVISSCPFLFLGQRRPC